MNFFQALAIIVIAVLLTFIIWQARSSFFRCAIGGKNTKITVVVTTSGSPGELEQSIKGLIRLISNNTLTPQTEIVIKNAWADSETAQMARILEREHPGIVVVQ